MANFKRKHPKKFTFRTCGYRYCIQDEVSVHTRNGRERYLPSYWRSIGGVHPWRYVHKNVPKEEVNIEA